MGFRPTATPLEWVAVFGLVALYILAITYLFAAIGLAASSPEAASGYGFILLFLPYLSSAFVPVDTMPDWLQWIAENQPITPVIETIRALLMGTPMGDSAWWAVGWCVAIIAAAAVWGRVAVPPQGRPALSGLPGRGARVKHAAPAASVRPAALV